MAEQLQSTNRATRRSCCCTLCIEAHFELGTQYGSCQVKGRVVVLKHVEGAADDGTIVV